MGWRDLHRTGSLLGVGVVIRDDFQTSTGNRQDRVFANDIRIALVFGMHGHAGIPQHGFRTCGRDRDETVFFAFDGIAEIPEVSVGLFLHHFEIGNCGVQLRVPVDQTLVLVDQPLLVERHEHFQHGLGQAFIHGETFARPVTGRTQTFELVQDRPTGFSFPLPDFLQKIFTANQVLVAIFETTSAVQLDALFTQLALDHHLGGDAGMVEARLPEDVISLHAAPADQQVLQCVVEGVPHMQAAGHVRRRNDDRVGRVFGAATCECTGLFPVLVKPPFDICRSVCFFECRHHFEPRFALCRHN